MPGVDRFGRAKCGTWGLPTTRNRDIDSLLPIDG